MKKLLWCVYLMTMSCLSLSAQSSSSGKKGADIAFDKTSHDYGTLKEGGNEVCFFEFTNTGDMPLEIKKVTASCGCTTPSYTKEPIAPGKKGVIEVSYNTIGRPGNFSKSITVYTNSIQHPTYALTIHGTVTPRENTPELLYPRTIGPLRLKRTMIPFGETKIGSIRTETIPVYNNSEETLTISFLRVPKHIKVVVTNSQLPAGGTAVVTVNYFSEQVHDYGRREDEFFIQVEGREKAQGKISLSANLMEDFSHLTDASKIPVAKFSNSTIQFGNVKKGNESVAYLELTNEGNATLHIRKLVNYVSYLDIKADRKDVPVGKSTRIKVVLQTAELQSKVRYYVEVITNDPIQPRKRILIQATIVD